MDSRADWMLSRGEYVNRALRKDALLLKSKLNKLEKNGVSKQTKRYQLLKRAIETLETIGDNASMGIYEGAYRDAIEKAVTKHVEKVEYAISRKFPVPATVRLHFKDVIEWSE